jgi:hypothetical protein
VILRNGLIDNTEQTYSFETVNSLDTCPGDNLFQWRGTDICLDYCPTGSESGTFPSACSEATDGEISTAVFTEITEFPMEWFPAQPFKGRYKGGLVDLIRGPSDPIFLPFRGLYFDGNDDFMRLVDFIFSGEG